MRRLHGCLGAVPRRPRRVLVLRAGIRTRPHSRLQVGRRLHLRMAQVQRLEHRGFRALAIADSRTDCGPSNASVYRELALLATTALPFGDAGSGGGAAGEGSGARTGDGSGGSQARDSEPGAQKAKVEVLSAGPNTGGQERLPSGSAAPFLPLADAGPDDLGGVLVLLVSLAAGGLWLVLTSPLWRRPR